MQFELIYTASGYHARLYNGKGELLFWTREYDYKQEVIDICAEVKMGVAYAMINDAQME